MCSEGEEVEFTVITDDRSGKLKAADVTGPNGAPVKGAPRRTGGFGAPRGGYEGGEQRGYGDRSYGGGM